MSKANWSDLTTRIASAAVMVVIALIANRVGGSVFLVFWLVAAIAVLAEWFMMVEQERLEWRSCVYACAGLTLIAVLCYARFYIAGVTLLVAGCGAVAATARLRGARHPFLLAAGLLYASAVVVPVVTLRGDGADGAMAVIILFASVWAADIMAYFTGRFVGGPKLWPSVSPKKTWSGFCGGCAFGGLAAGIAGTAFSLIPLGVVIAIISQGGDLFESSLKRRFGAKDAGRLIPGHGGVMDRLDGFIAAAVVALIIGMFRDSIHPASGFISW